MLSGNGNALQVAPVLTSASSTSASTVVQGTLTAAPNATYQIQFFANPAADPSGFGQGQTYLATKTVTTNGSGVASFSFTIKPALAAGEVVSATATSPSNNTSAFSNDVTVTAPPAAAVAAIVGSAPPAPAAPSSIVSPALAASSAQDDSVLTALAVDQVHAMKHHVAARSSHKLELAAKIKRRVKTTHPQPMMFRTRPRSLISAKATKPEVRINVSM